MKKTMLIVILFIFMSNNMFATPVSDNGKLQVVGLQLSNECGSAVQLKGISSMGLQWFGIPNGLNYNTMQYLANTVGIDVFRAAMYIDEGGYTTDPAGYRAQVEQIVDWCEQLGIYVLIDWHILNPGDPNNHTNEAKTFFSYMSNKYKDKDHVLYEICNEPNGVSWSTVKSYAEQVIPVIRANDPNSVIIVGTPNWSQLGSDVVNNQLSYSNIMYTFHFYAATHSTSMVTPYINQIPIFCTEWGISEASGSGAIDTANATNFLNIFDGNTGGPKISWAGWSWCDKNETSAYLNPGTFGNIPPSLTAAGSYVVGKIQENADNWTACNAVTATYTETWDPNIPTFTPTQTPVFDPIRVNAGGPQWNDGGTIWSADKQYTTGSWGYQGGGGVSDQGGIAIGNTTQDTLYNTERYGNPSYLFDIQNGTYTVTLKFSENYWDQNNERVFSVTAEGTTVVNNLDLIAAVGQNNAYDVTFEVTVNDGQLTINSSSSVDGALFNAIEILGGPMVTPTYTSTNTLIYTHTYTNTSTITNTYTRTYTSTPTHTFTETFTNTYTETNTPTETGTNTWDPSVDTYTATPTETLVPFDPIFVNAGGPQYDDGVNVWLADQEYGAMPGSTWGYTGGGGTADNTGSTVYNNIGAPLADDTIYETERYGSPSYTFDNIPDGEYEVTLHFVEIYWTDPGDRVFSVDIEGVEAVKGLDLVATVGNSVAQMVTVIVTVSDGQLNITSSATADGALFNAIEIRQYVPVTITPTETNTMIPTQTFTATDTNTAIPPTLTFTSTETETNTQVPSTETFTATETETDTLVPNTSTYTATSTETFTHTATYSFTHTHTYTFTSTVTDTPTDTPTDTVTNTPSETATGSPVDTWTFTQTYTETATATDTNTPTATGTETQGLTDTNTPTETFTETFTHSITYSFTPTFTDTNTVTETPTDTLTATETNTPSETATGSPVDTWTFTQTYTDTATATDTETPTVIDTQTQGLTDTNTPTETFTETFTHTVTYTATETETWVVYTFTPTHTYTPTETSTTDNPSPTTSTTATPTPAPTEEELVIDDILVYPNPYNSNGSDRCRFRFKLSQNAEEIRLRIYTASFRCIRDEKIIDNGVMGENIAELKADRLENLANGTYYFVLTGKSDKGDKVKSKIDKLMILK